MFKQIKPHKKVVTFYGDTYAPVATLVDENKRICHLIVDDKCYVSIIWQDNFGFVPTPYIYPEVFEIMENLGPPQYL